LTSLNQNRYDQLLRRVGDLKGPGSKVNDALTELFPMIDVENVPAELLLLSGTRLCMGTAFLGAGGAGMFSTFFLANPAASGVIARVMTIAIRALGTQEIVIGPSQNSSAAIGATAFSDTRVFGEGTVLGIQGANNNLAVGSTFFKFSHLANGTTFFEPPAAIAVLAPGGRLSVGGDENAGLDCSFIWVERVAQPSELSL